MERIVTLELSVNEQHEIMLALEARRKVMLELARRAELNGHHLAVNLYEETAKCMEALRLKVFASQENWAK